MHEYPCVCVNIPHCMHNRYTPILCLLTFGITLFLLRINFSFITSSTGASQLIRRINIIPSLKGIIWRFTQDLYEDYADFPTGKSIRKKSGIEIPLHLGEENGAFSQSIMRKIAPWGSVMASRFSSLLRSLSLLLFRSGSFLVSLSVSCLFPLLFPTLSSFLFLATCLFVCLFACVSACLSVFCRSCL